jgi:hypothetical protein
MSTLKTNTIQHLTSGFNNIVTHTDGAGTVNAAHCRSWVNFNGTATVAIRASFNVTSITDLGTGRYTINITNALSDANYCCTGTSSYSTGDQIGWDVNLGDLSTTSYTMTCTNTLNGARADGELQSCAVFR